MAEIQCPYHHASWRGRTQQVLNALRGSLLHPGLTKRFSSIVCVCRGRWSAASRETPDDAPSLSAWLRSKPSCLPGEVCGSLQRYLTAAAQLTPAELGLGLVHMVSVIHKAAHGKLDEVRSGLPPVKPGLKEDQWTLALPSTYLGLLVGQNGQHVKKFCEEYRVSIYFRKKFHSSHKRLCHRQSFSNDGVQVTVVSRKGEVVDIEQIKRRFEARAEDLKAKRKAHEEAVEQFRKRAREWVWMRRCNTGGQHGHCSSGVHRDSKEAATDHYHRKHQQKTKTRHPPRNQPHSAISEGHCLNCLTPYSPNLTETGACTFHAGFLTAVKAGKNRGYRWTCCGRRTAQHRATHHLHTHSGCSSGRHRWRAGRDGARKTRDSRLTHHHSDDIILI